MLMGCQAGCLSLTSCLSSKCTQGATDSAGSNISALLCCHSSGVKTHKGYCTGCKWQSCASRRCNVSTQSQSPGLREYCCLLPATCPLLSKKLHSKQAPPVQQLLIARVFICMWAVVGIVKVKGMD